MNIQEAASVVLGCLLRDPKEFITTDVREEMFPDSRTRTVYNAIIALGPDGTTSAVIDHLKLHGKLRAVGVKAVEEYGQFADATRFTEALNVLWGGRVKGAIAKAEQRIAESDHEPNPDAAISDALGTLKDVAMIRPNGLSPEHVKGLREVREATEVSLSLNRLGDDFTVGWDRYGVAIRVQQVRDYGDGLAAELTITHEVDGILHFGRLVFASTSGREQLVRKLGKMAPGLPWARMIEDACFKISTQMRDGDPIEELRPALTDPDPPVRYTIDRLVPEGKVAILFGDGDNLKSTFALGVVLAAVAKHDFPNGYVGGPLRALYLDWEDDRLTAVSRVKPIMRGFGLTEAPPGFFYKRMVAPLDDVTAVLRAEIARLKIGLVVIDSMGAASGPEPETPSTAIRTMMAARRLETSVLAVAHVSKATALNGKPGGSTIFGSVYYRNLARATIEVRRAEDQPDSDGNSVKVGLYPKKSNYGPRFKPTAVQVVFGGGQIVFQEADIAEEVDLLRNLPTGAQIATVLRHRSLTIQEVADALGKTYDAARMGLQRLLKAKQVIELAPEHNDEGEKAQKRYALRSRRAE